MEQLLTGGWRQHLPRFICGKRLGHKARLRGVDPSSQGGSWSRGKGTEFLRYHSKGGVGFLARKKSDGKQQISPSQARA